MSRVLARRSKLRWGAVTIIALALCAGSRPARACSICRCGDPAFGLLGPQFFPEERWRLGFDWERFAKQSGISDPSGEIVGLDRETENRFTVSASYGWRGRLHLMLRLPTTARQLETHDTGAGPARHALSSSAERIESRGLGDPELLAHYKVWASPMKSLGRTTWVAVSAALKTPWGENEKQQGGERLDEHAQPGTGATDVTVGLSAAHVIDLRSTLFGSVQRRRSGANDFGYDYGDVTLLNLGYERKLSDRFDAVLELNYRDAGGDIVDRSGEKDPNTGGRLYYLQPRLIVTLNPKLLLRAAVFVPVADRLRGEQTERAVLNAGVSVLF